jgi:hypothetical protein
MHARRARLHESLNSADNLPLTISYISLSINNLVQRSDSIAKGSRL